VACYRLLTGDRYPQSLLLTTRQVVDLSAGGPG